MKVVFVSVIYDAMKDYIYDFIKSIKEQTYKEFDILIGNDGFSNNEELENIKKMKNCTIINYCNSGFNPSEIRLDLMKSAISRKYDLLVWGDSDDIFSKNRIETITKAYEEDISILYNDLFIMRQNIDFFNNKLPALIDNTTILDDYNFIGMSNSAINLKEFSSKVLEKKMNLKYCIAFDWFIYGFAVKCGLKGKKVEGCKTFYRLYDDNIAGDTKTLTREKINTGIKIKKFQYSQLEKYDENFKYKLEEIESLAYKIQNDEFCNSYIQYMNKRKNENVFWWQNIRDIGEDYEKVCL